MQGNLLDLLRLPGRLGRLPGTQAGGEQVAELRPLHMVRAFDFKRARLLSERRKNGVVLLMISAVLLMVSASGLRPSASWSSWAVQGDCFGFSTEGWRGLVFRQQFLAPQRGFCLRWPPIKVPFEELTTSRTPVSGTAPLWTDLCVTGQWGFTKILESSKRPLKSRIPLEQGPREGTPSIVNPANQLGRYGRRGVGLRPAAGKPRRLWGRVLASCGSAKCAACSYWIICKLYDSTISHHTFQCWIPLVGKAALATGTALRRYAATGSKTGYWLARDDEEIQSIYVQIEALASCFCLWGSDFLGTLAPCDCAFAHVGQKGGRPPVGMGPGVQMITQTKNQTQNTILPDPRWTFKVTPALLQQTQLKIAQFFVEFTGHSRSLDADRHLTACQGPQHCQLPFQGAFTFGGVRCSYYGSSVWQLWQVVTRNMALSGFQDV